MLFFVKSPYFTYFGYRRCTVYRLKNIKNSFIRVQKSNWHITGTCRNLSITFKARVQFLMPKKPCRKSVIITAGSSSSSANVNCKRKTVVTWHSLVCCLLLTMKVSHSVLTTMERCSNSNYHSFKIFFPFLIASSPQLILHNQLALTKFRRRLRSVVKWRQ